MFNLLVTAGEGSWDQPSYVLGVDRFLEHTDNALKARFSGLDAEAKAALIRLPTLFAYETDVDQPARAGWIRTIQKRGSEIRITYEIDFAIDPLESKKIEELVWELEINNYEMNRTHWAVKGSDLMKILRSASLLADDYQPAATQRHDPICAFSRQTVIAACSTLSKLGHTGLDRFLLELGVEGVNAGRDRGSLLARSNALAEFVIGHKMLRTTEGDPLDLAVVRKAAHLHNVDEGSSDPFWSSLRRDGYGLQDGRIIALSQPPIAVPPPHALVQSAPKETLPTSIGDPMGVRLGSPPKTRKVFLVHGRNHGALHEVARYMERLGLEVIILHERPNGGRTLISKFREESADIGFAVVLMTPDDVGRHNKEEGLTPRARQNVVFELGFFVGKLGPERVCALVAGPLEKPSDFEAVVYVEFGPGTNWRSDLARELRAADIPFDHSKFF